jgi:hypothetical protein
MRVMPAFTAARPISSAEERERARVSTSSCKCEYDEIIYDCGHCSDGLICVECDDRFKGLELSISVFYS